MAKVVSEKQQRKADVMVSMSLHHHRQWLSPEVVQTRVESADELAPKDVLRTIRSLVKAELAEQRGEALEFRLTKEGRERVRAFDSDEE